MKIFVTLLLAIVFVFSSMPAMASAGSCGSKARRDAPMERVSDRTSGDSSMVALDDKIGAGTSDRLAAQRSVDYNTDTGMMDVVPSDSRGNIQD